jgi:O-antigen/teichoic acid export membrane protein
VLPGHRNRLRLEPEATRELISYGKWIFLSTVAGFAVMQSDKLVLGYFLSMEDLGRYNIGFFLASVPLMLGQALIGRLMIPIYRANPPSASPENFSRLRRVRFILTGALLLLTLPLAIMGFWLVDVLYDERYAAAGAVLVTVSLALIPQIIVLTYDQVALAQGDSRGFFTLTAIRAVFLIVMMVLAVPAYGALGAALAIALAPVLSYPLIVRLAKRHGAWDARHDIVTGAAALALAAIALWVDWTDLVTAFDG